MHLKYLEYREPENREKYPFNIPIFRNFVGIEFNTPVTIFVGENGAGKSTLIEGLAATIGSITIGEDSIEYDKSLKSARELAERLKLTWSIKTKKGFFLRAEDFISYSKKISSLVKNFEEDLKKVEDDYRDRSDWAKSYAKMPYESSLHGIKDKYGDGLEHKSHGESFLDLFNARLVPNGLYLLDEPETPLSPMKQLALISLINQMTEENCQFIIATHSPILMAIPRAKIFLFEDDEIKQVEYDELDHVNITRDFLNNPAQYLRYL